MAMSTIADLALIVGLGSPAAVLGASGTGPEPDPAILALRAACRG